MISADDLQAKLTTFVGSPQGKKVVKSKLNDLASSGKASVGGGEVISKADMREAARLFVELLKKHIPDSIDNTTRNIETTEPKKLKTGEHKITIKFDKDAIHRESLYPEDDYEDGLYNIVALLNKGYKNNGAQMTKAYVYGEWHGNSGGPGEKIMPMTMDEAQSWAEEHLDGDDYIAIFGEPEEGKQNKTFSLSNESIKQLEELQAKLGGSLSAVVEGLIMDEKS